MVCRSTNPLLHLMWPSSVLAVLYCYLHLWLESEKEKWNKWVLVIQHQWDESELRKSDNPPLFFLWHIANSLITRLLSCLASSSWVLSWQTNPVTVGNKSNIEAQITEAWVFTRLRRIGMFSWGEGNEEHLFFNLFCWWLLLRHHLHNLSKWQLWAGSARAQRWHYLQMVNKEKYLASKHDS